MLAPKNLLGVKRTVSSLFNQEEGPQPPKVLKTPVEVVANLRQLQQNHDPLIITFAERSQRFTRLVRSLMENDEGVAIITMLLDDTYQQALHAPVAPPEPLPPPAHRAEQPSRRAEQPERRPRKRSRRRG